MTNSEYLKAMVPDVSEEVRNTVMETRGVKPFDTFEKGKEVELAEADLYHRLLLLPEFSEGSLSIKYNAAALKEQANFIYKKHGDARYDSGQPLIRRFKL